jgi:hypothetical protein
MVEEQTQIRGFPIPVAGTYVLLDDVVSALRVYAQSLTDPEAGALVHELASWLNAGEEPPSHNAEPSLTSVEVHGAEVDDVTPDVARIEVFPDPPDDPRPKWYARSIDTGGHILKTTNGSFDYEWVVQNAQERFPGIDIHLLKNAGDDSMWTENQTSAMFKNQGNRGAFPSVGPPIRRLFADQVT